MVHEQTCTPLTWSSGGGPSLSRPSLHNPLYKRSTKRILHCSLGWRSLVVLFFYDPLQPDTSVLPRFWSLLLFDIKFEILMSLEPLSFSRPVVTWDYFHLPSHFKWIPLVRVIPETGVRHGDGSLECPGRVTVYDSTHRLSIQYRESYWVILGVIPTPHSVLGINTPSYWFRTFDTVSKATHLLWVVLVSRCRVLKEGGLA